MDSRLYFDAERFEEVAPGRDRRQAGTSRFTRQGAWVARWLHWSARVLDWVLDSRLPRDMPWARSAIEAEYHSTIAPTVVAVAGGEMRVRSAAEYGGWRPTLSALYFASDWSNWARDCSMERRLRGRANHDLYFVGWHNQEFFSVREPARFRVYQAVGDLWIGMVETPFVYPVPTPWLYIYFSHITIRASSSTFAALERMAIYEFAWLSVPVILSVAQYGTFYPDCRDPRLERGGGGALTIPVIAPIPPRLWEVYEAIGLTRLVESFEDPVRSLVVFRRIADVDWRATFAHRRAGGSGEWLPYDFATGEVGSAPAHTGLTREGESRAYDAVEPVLFPGSSWTPTSDCEAEWKRRRDEIKEEGEQREAAQDREVRREFRLTSSLRTACTMAGLHAPVNHDELVGAIGQLAASAERANSTYRAARVEVDAAMERVRRLREGEAAYTTEIAETKARVKVLEAEQEVMTQRVEAAETAAADAAGSEEVVVDLRNRLAAAEQTQAQSVLMITNLRRAVEDAQRRAGSSSGHAALAEARRQLAEAQAEVERGREASQELEEQLAAATKELDETKSREKLNKRSYERMRVDLAASESVVGGLEEARRRLEQERDRAVRARTRADEVREAAQLEARGLRKEGKKQRAAAKAAKRKADVAKREAEAELSRLREELRVRTEGLQDAVGVVREMSRAAEEVHARFRRNADAQRHVWECYRSMHRIFGESRRAFAAAEHDIKRGFAAYEGLPVPRSGDTPVDVPEEGGDADADIEGAETMRELRKTLTKANSVLDEYGPVEEPPGPVVTPTGALRLRLRVGRPS